MDLRMHWTSILSFVTGFEVCVFSCQCHRVLDGDLIVPPDPFFYMVLISYPELRRLHGDFTQVFKVW